MPQNVYLVEDENDLSVMVSRFLASAGFEVETFGRGDQALDAIRATPPDLAVVDVMLPGLDGLELLQKMRAWTNCPVLLISARAAEIDRILGLELGADDFLPKPFSGRELVARVKALFRRLERQGSPAETSGNGVAYRNLYLDLDRKTLSCGQSTTPLTLSEYYILRRLMANPTKIFSRDELLEPPVPHRGGESRAVDMHITNLRKKIQELDAGFQPIRSIRGIGYRFAI